MSLPSTLSIRRLAVAGVVAVAVLVYALQPGESAPIAAPKVTASATVSLDLVAPREAEPSPPAKPAKTVRAASRPRRAAAQPLAPAGSQQRTALIIGINKAAGAEALAGAVPDAKNIRTALLRYGFPDGNIKMLLDGEATRPAIISELRSLAARTSPSGIAVFGLASHSGKTSFRSVEGARITASRAGFTSGCRPWPHVERLVDVLRRWLRIAGCYRQRTYRYVLVFSPRPHVGDGIGRDVSGSQHGQ